MRERCRSSRYSARHTLELLPQLERVKVLRTWTGLCDLSPDYSPILGKTEIDNFHVSTGWGTYGFKAAPIVGVTLAELVATGRRLQRSSRPSRSSASTPTRSCPSWRPPR